MYTYRHQNMRIPPEAVWLHPVAPTTLAEAPTAGGVNLPYLHWADVHVLGSPQGLPESCSKWTTSWLFFCLQTSSSFNLSSFLSLPQTVWQMIQNGNCDPQNPWRSPFWTIAMPPDFWWFQVPLTWPGSSHLSAPSSSVWHPPEDQIGSTNICIGHSHPCGIQAIKLGLWKEPKIGLLLWPAFAQDYFGEATWDWTS